MRGKLESCQAVRQTLYENIIDEAVFIARASEGAISVEWIMEQPIFIRKRYFASFQKEVEERKESMNSATKKK